jgi:hypothetical protein
MQEALTLNTQEQKRVGVLNRILAGQLSAAEATVLLKLSQRQVQRILATYRRRGSRVSGNDPGVRFKEAKKTFSSDATFWLVIACPLQKTTLHVLRQPISRYSQRQYSCLRSAID